jgi:uncharacterized protein
MVLFLDSSALFKLYVDETDSDKVVELVKKAKSIAVSTLALPETARILYRMEQEGTLTHAQRDKGYRQLLDDWDNLFRIVLDNSISKEASLLTQTFGLKGADSAQLATALHVSRRNAGMKFLAFDVALNTAAEKAGLTLA